MKPLLRCAILIFKRIVPSLSFIHCPLAHRAIMKDLNTCLSLLDGAPAEAQAPHLCLYSASPCILGSFQLAPTPSVQWSTLNLIMKKFYWWSFWFLTKGHVWNDIYWWLCHSVQSTFGKGRVKKQDICGWLLCQESRNVENSYDWQW